MIESVFSRVLAMIQYQQFIAGLLGGIISSIILHPFDLINIRLQVTETKPTKTLKSGPYRPTYKNFFDAVRSIYLEKGLVGLYEGVTPNVMGNGIAWGLYLLIYNTIVVWNNDQKQIKNLAFQSRLIYSTIAGLITIISTNPIWVIKTRMCLQYSKSKSVDSYRNMFHAFRIIYQLEGMKAFYKGLIPALLGTFHGTIQFSLYEQMKVFYMNLFHITYCPLPIIFIFSTLSKLIAGITTYPTQVVRTCLQDQHQHYKNTTDVIRKTYKRDGINGFFKGVRSALYRVIPASCITFVVYEFVLRSMI
jgi:solute carrier family 25 folate transporter 32